MNAHDLEATKILFLFNAVLNINNTQGIGSFDELQDEASEIIDEILNFRYSGDNSNIKDGFSQINVWHNGLKLLQQRILEQNPETT